MMKFFHKYFVKKELFLFSVAKLREFKKNFLLKFLFRRKSYSFPNCKAGIKSRGFNKSLEMCSSDFNRNKPLNKIRGQSNMHKKSMVNVKSRRFANNKVTMGGSFLLRCLKVKNLFSDGNNTTIALHPL